MFLFGKFFFFFFPLGSSEERVGEGVAESTRTNYK